MTTTNPLVARACSYRVGDLQHSPNTMLIPGTSSVDHLRENVAGAALVLPADAVAKLDAI